MTIAPRGRQVLFVAVFAVMLAAGFQFQRAHAQARNYQSVTLQRTYKTGTTEKYIHTTVTEIQRDAPPVCTHLDCKTSPQKTTTTYDETVTYGKIIRGTAEIVSVQGDISVQSNVQYPFDRDDQLEGGGGIWTGVLNGNRTVGKIDGQNRVTVEGTSPEIMKIRDCEPVVQRVGLPPKPVFPGEKWKTESGYECYGLEGAIENTYVGEVAIEGKAAYRITFKGQFKRANTMLMSSAIRGFSDTTVDIMGEAILDKTDCSILSVTTNTTYTNPKTVSGDQQPIMDQKIQKTQKRVS